MIPHGDASSSPVFGPWVGCWVCYWPWCGGWACCCSFLVGGHIFFLCSFIHIFIFIDKWGGQCRVDSNHWEADRSGKLWFWDWTWWRPTCIYWYRHFHSVNDQNFRSLTWLYLQYLDHITATVDPSPHPAVTRLYTGLSLPLHLQFPMTRYDYTIQRQMIFINVFKLEELRKVKDSEGSQLENNYRPLQDLNGRIVTLYA